jgi:ribulose 1,5-bisphosphate carboxylase large subunit-like protein
VFLANYQYGQHPAHAHQHLHTLTRREDGVKFHLRITTITAGCLGMQVIAIRGVDSGKLMYAKTEMEFEMLGKAKVAIAPIWPPTNEAVRWSSLEVMTTEDVENWTEMWSKAENVFAVPSSPTAS